MENFGGMTPYEVTKKLGFPAHYSQQKGWGWYFAGKDTAASIKDYSPCKYGLYRTTVGEDVQKTDMFENLTTHTELARQEEAARLEAERLAASMTEPETSAPVTEAASTEPEIQTPESTTASTEETVSSQPATPEKETNMTVWLIAEIVLILLLAVLITVKCLTRKQRR